MAVCHDRGGSLPKLVETGLKQQQQIQLPESFSPKQVIRPRESIYYKSIVQAGLLLNVGSAKVERVLNLYGPDAELREGEPVTFDQGKMDLITHEINIDYLLRAQAVDDKVIAQKKREEGRMWLARQKEIRRSQSM